MKAMCPKCLGRYDDAELSTICPHDRLPPAGPTFHVGTPWRSGELFSKNTMDAVRAVNEQAVRRGMSVEQYLFLKIAEEATEVAKEAMKAMQFGKDEIMPGQPLSNADRVFRELIDLHECYAMAADHGFVRTLHDMPEGELTGMMSEKRAKVIKYAGYSVELGCLTEVPNAKGYDRVGGKPDGTPQSGGPDGVVHASGGTGQTPAASGVPGPDGASPASDGR